MLFESHSANFDEFDIFVKENNWFKWQLQESLLKTRDRSVFNENIYLFSSKLFDFD